MRDLLEDSKLELERFDKLSYANSLMLIDRVQWLQAQLAAAERLMSQVVEEHADPESWTYNFCEDEPCEWCLEASAAINHPGSIDRDSTEGVK